jgi:hypothetical protein
MRNKGVVIFIPISLNARFNIRRLAGVLNGLHLEINIKYIVINETIQIEK